MVSQILVSIQSGRDTEGLILHLDKDKGDIIHKALKSLNILATNIQCYSRNNLSLNRIVESSADTKNGNTFILMLNVQSHEAIQSQVSQVKNL